MTLFVAHTRNSFFTRPFPAPILLFAIISAQIVTALIAGFGWFVPPTPWEYVGLIWAYCLFLVFVEDGLKLWVYRHLEHQTDIHSHFLSSLKVPLLNYSIKRNRPQNRP